MDKVALRYGVGPLPACCPWCGIPACEGSSCSLLLQSPPSLLFPHKQQMQRISKELLRRGEERMRISVERVQRSRLFLVMFRSFYGVLVPLLNMSRCASKGICFVKEEGGWCCCCWILILLQVPVNWRGDFNARNLITYHTPSSSILVSSSGHISGVQFKHHHLLE